MTERNELDTSENAFREFPGEIDLITKELKKGDNISTVIIPDGVTSIGAYAFAHFSSLNIEYKGTVAEWEAINKARSWNDCKDKCIVKCSDGADMRKNGIE